MEHLKQVKNLNPTKRTDVRIPSHGLKSDKVSKCRWLVGGPARPRHRDGVRPLPHSWRPILGDSMT